MKAYVRQMIPNRLKKWMRTKLHSRVSDRFDELIEPYRRAKMTPFVDDCESNLARLRMHAHIIDKGLHRPDWQFGHGETCYSEAKRLLGKITGFESDPTLVWADKVIREYEAAQKGVRHISPESVFQQQTAVEPEYLKRFFCLRTTCRNFEEKAVSCEDLFSIIDAALQASSSCCRQTLKVYGSVDPKIVRETASCFSGFTGFSDFIPSALVFCADIRSYYLPGELFAPTFDTALAADHAALMAAAMGMSMGMLCWVPDSDRERRLRALHNIPEYETIVVGAVCGYPKQLARKPPRKSAHETLILT